LAAPGYPTPRPFFARLLWPAEKHDNKNEADETESYAPAPVFTTGRLRCPVRVARVSHLLNLFLLAV
ncbi:hypothetical protein BaRGS_00023572, partial [Batillaria attramentaria]